MLNPARRLRILLTTLAFGLAVPAAAQAAEAAPAAKAEKDKEARKKASFPMSGDGFKAKVEARLKKAETRLERMLEKRKAPAETKERVRSRFTEVAGKIRKAAAAAAKDGTVSKEEAAKVRDLWRELRNARGKDKPGKGQARGKRGNPGRRAGRGGRPAG
jgi:hypothetical protein